MAKEKPPKKGNGFYFVVAGAGGEPETYGPYPDARARDRDAYDVMGGDHDTIEWDGETDTILTLHVSAAGVPTVGTYSNAFALGRRP